MKITANPTLSNINLASLQEGAKSLGNNDKVRAKTTGVFDKSVELYSSSKAHGSFSKESTRTKKQEGALDFINTALSNTLQQVPGGDPGHKLARAFNSILVKYTPTEGDLTGKDFKNILNEAQAVLDQHAITSMRSQSGAYSTAALDSLRKLPDVPTGTVAAGGNVIRSNSLRDGDLQGAFEKVQAGKMDELTPHEGVNGLRKLWEGMPPVPLDKLGTLLQSPDVSGCVGKWTSANTLKDPTKVPDNSQGEKNTSAGRLKTLIDTTLTPTEKLALKERVDYLSTLADLAQSKLGAPSDSVKNNPTESTKVWIKSMGVSSQAYLGTKYEDMAQQIGSPKITEAAAKSQDLMTALILHKDLIFT